MRRWFVVLALVLHAITAWAGTADAHTDEAQAEWYAHWQQRAARGLTPDLLDEWRDFTRRHEPAPVAPHGHETVRPSPYTGMGTDVEQWRNLVAAYFPSGEVDTALCVMRWESGGNPTATNPSSGAAGLFQVMPFWWDHHGGDRYDPDTNVRTARKIWDQQGWRGWSAYNRGRC